MAINDIILLKVICETSRQSWTLKGDMGFLSYGRFMIMVLIVAVGAQTIFLVIPWVSRYAFVCLHIFDLRADHRLFARGRPGYLRARAHCVGCRC